MNPLQLLAKQFILSEELVLEIYKVCGLWAASQEDALKMTKAICAVINEYFPMEYSDPG